MGDSRWLAGQGVTRQLAESYKRTGWLDALGRGAFLRAGDTAQWTGGLYALQRYPDCLIHAAGKTALGLLGYGHFLETGDSAPIWLFGRSGERLPAWFAKGPWQDRLRFMPAALLDDSLSVSTALVQHAAEGLPLRISSAELAILEVLYFVPRMQSVEESALLMEGLATLRPKLLQHLLEACRSVKVKRLFAALAEASGHRWFAKIDFSRVDFGSGKRQVVAGGHLHPKYLITLPSKMISSKS